MKERLTNNLGLKILSVVLAIFMWLIMVNVSNPLVRDNVEVSVEMINADVLEDSNLTYEVVGRSTVSVYYDVHIRDQNRITASDFAATADLAQLYDVTGSIPVEVTIADRDVRGLIDENSIEVRPNVVRVQTEELQRKRFTLTARSVGTPEDGYATGTIRLNPQYIYVTGAESVIGQISSVGVEISVEGANSDLIGSAAINFYDANGNKLTSVANEVTTNRDKVSYTVSILRVKALAVDYQVEGEVSDGYRFTGVESTITSIAVEGLRSTLASLNTLTVPGSALRLNGATADVVREVDLADYLPENVTVADGENSIAQVTLRVEALETRNVQVDLDQAEITGQREGYTYTFDQDVMTLQIQGLSEDLDVLVEDNIRVSLDVSDLEPGDYRADFVIDLDEGFELMGHDDVNLAVEEEGSEEAADASEEETESRT